MSPIHRCTPCGAEYPSLDALLAGDCCPRRIVLNASANHIEKCFACGSDSGGAYSRCPVCGISLARESERIYDADESFEAEAFRGETFTRRDRIIAELDAKDQRDEMREWRGHE